MIYAIEADGLNLVKIGRSQNPLERFASLKTASPVPLKLLCCVEWPDENENLIHRAFSGNRHNGEWFRIDSDLADFLNVMMCPNSTQKRKFEFAMEMLAERLNPQIEENEMTFSEEVADLGLTKESLGEALGVAFSTVQMWGEDPPLYALAYLKIFRENKDLVAEMTEWVEGLQDILPQAD